MLRRSLGLLALAAAAACTPNGIDGGRCVQDSDCSASSGETCVFDLTRATSYCSHACSVDSDCAADQTCRTGVDVAESGAAQTKLCIDRVRMCEMVDRCNGLDDDCDGTVDGPMCTPITDCLDDAACGTFICRAPDNQPSTLCAPANTSATVRSFDPCTSDDECATGLCETGLCSPLCRAFSTECDQGMVCAHAIGPRARPPHNACQKLCVTTADCPIPQECVFRDVYRGPNPPAEGMHHAFVCSLPGPDRKPLGAACTANTPEGDDECANGLCFGRVCTHGCDNNSCSDVGAGFVCLRETLHYGTDEIGAKLCEHP